MKKINLNQFNFKDHVAMGDVIGWPQGPGEPLALTKLLISQGSELGKPTLLFGLTQSDTLRPEIAEHFKFHALNGAGTSRRVTHLAEIFPAHVSSLPMLFRSKALKLDVMLIQVRPLGKGQFTLGVISDFTQAMIQTARVVIAILNPSLPPLSGDALVEESDIDVLVDGDDQIINMPDPAPTDIERTVARLVASLIPDKATIQLGVGTLPAAVSAALVQHKDLGVHSGVVSDVLVDLVEKGIVTNAFKSCDAGKTVTGGLFGTQKLRDFAAQTQSVQLRSADYTHNAQTTAQLANFFTINSGIEIDLSGQVNAEVAGGRYLGAVGGYVDFVRAGGLSQGGRSIIAFPSTTPDGKHSRIVSSLVGRPVTAARSDIDMVVTEFGIAELRGKSFKDRARSLLKIAHPSHREALEISLNDNPSFY